MKITINCCLCDKQHETEIALPDGWTHRYDGMDDNLGFCPEHAMIAEFAEEQCPGCTGGWGDCPLWKGFAYSRRRNLHDADFKRLEAGFCPRRVNGTIGLQRGRLEKLDLSEQAPTAAGAALAKAIKDYWERYPE